MFATFAGSYSRKPLPAQPDLLGDAERRLREGRLDEAGWEEVADEYVREILAEMAVVELAIVGEGGVRSPDRVLPWIHGLEGLTAGGETTLADGEAATRPVVRGPVRWTSPLMVRDWQFADGETDLYVKQTMVGPYSLAALADPKPGPRRADLAIQLGEALNQEIRALVGAGCAVVEIDEPMVLPTGDNATEWAAFRAAHERLTAGVDDPAILHLSLGLWGSPIDPAGHAPMIDLPYSSYLVDVLAGPSAWRFIGAVPADRGIIVGAADAHREAMEETEVLVWAMAWAAQGGRGPDRVGIAPNGSLAFLGRHFAHRKCQRISEAVNIARMGPLQEVAEALDESPIRSRMRELREMAQAVAAGRD